MSRRLLRMQRPLTRRFIYSLFSDDTRKARVVVTVCEVRNRSVEESIDRIRQAAAPTCSSRGP